MGGPIMKKTMALLLGVGIAAAAMGQDYPARPLRFVVPNPPGGTVDIVARAVAQVAGPRFGQAIVVEPKPGGNSIIGMDVVARAAPDGYTVLVAAVGALTINPLITPMPFDGARAFAPVAMLAGTPNVIVVHPSVPARSLQELIALAKAKPKSLNYASGFQASGMHLAAERLKSLGGFDMNYIPFQGGIQAVLATVGGHAEVAVVPLSDAAPHIAAGRLRALAITSLTRFDLVKDVPTVAESGFPGFESMQWFGAYLPAGTPRPIVARLSEEMRRALDNPELRAMFEKQCLVPTPLAPEELAALMQSETRMYAALIREYGIKAE
jgi:tripartite-type tricarboxylate transporter receptor subunit TctC